jgi:hypothetical protein
LWPDSPNWLRYQHASDFLWEPESEWPEQKFLAPLTTILSVKICAIGGVEATLLEVHWVFRLAATVTPWFSKLRRSAQLERAVKALVSWRRCKNLGITYFPKMEDMSVGEQEIGWAENNLIRVIQKEDFPSEIKKLQVLDANEPLSRKELRSTSSPLSSFNPFLDLEGILRCGGRLVLAPDLSYDAKFPILLPKGGEHVNALILHIHVREGHAGVNHVLNCLRKKYWILKGGSAVRKVVTSCIICQMFFKKPAAQKMAPLPVDRLKVVSPFENSGVDVFGPYGVKNGGRATLKRWVVLFTCMSTRAVHMEILRDMSTPTFINALVRFHSRRPGLRRLYSDQGTNFTGACNALQKAIKEWNAADLAKTLPLRGIEWVFGSPEAPHTGGVWERLVKSAKKHLSVLFTKDKLDVEIFQTILVEVEGILNRRPLTQASSDPRDYDALTPADFLYPGVVMHSSVHVLPPTPLEGEDLRFVWKRARSLVDEFWKLWSRDYLSSLHERSKWRNTTPDLLVGQLVLIVDKLNHRDQWRKGRVEEIISDGSHVRKALVRVAGGTLFERHVAKLVPLEI